MKIAVIQYGIPLQSHTRDLVNALVAAGCRVSLLIADADDTGFVDVSSIKAETHIVDTGGRFMRFLRRQRARLAAGISLELAIVPLRIRRAFCARVREGGPFDLLIGIEKGGLELATCCATRVKTPVVYYSLELYLDDHPSRHEFHWQRPSEIRCHRLAAGTIVQDAFRWRALYEAKGFTDQEPFLLPVGVRRGLDAPAVPRALPATREEPVTVLYMGGIIRERYCEALADCAPRLADGVCLHLHGPVYDSGFEDELARRRSARFDLSTELLDEGNLRALIAAAAIGVALYARDYANDRLTAFSSHKIAYYLRAGLPVILFRTEASARLMELHDCGRLIESVDELPAAVDGILADYARYSAAAQAAFAAIYDLDRYWPDLLRYLEDRVRPKGATE